MTTTTPAGTAATPAHPLGRRVPAGDGGDAGPGPARQRRRLHFRLGKPLWAWLHAQDLLSGPATPPADPGVAEDDYRRFAARRDNSAPTAEPRRP